MTKKGDNSGKVGGVKSTQRTTHVEQTEAISGIKQVKATASVGAVKGAGAVDASRLTRTMSYAEREEYFRLIEEEYTKLLEQGVIPKSQAAAIKGAVKMTIDTGLIEEDTAVKTAGKKS